jgi:hypothetical protein
MSKSNSWTSTLAQLLPMAAVAGLAVAGYHLVVGNSAVAERVESGARRPVTALVVIDTQALVKGKIDLATEQIASGQTFSEEQLTMQGHNFGAELMRALQEYRDAGVLVIDRRHALAIPPAADVTQEVAARLGVKVVATPDPFAAPATE